MADRCRQHASFKLLVLSPFRLGSEPNVRVGVATITSAPDAVNLHEKSIDEMWRRALKGQDAAACLRRLLAQDGKRDDSEKVARVDGTSEKKPARRRAAKS